jgi:4-diphosphocytidyl-2-C-methyl-D-erythritol kinase
MKTKAYAKLNLYLDVVRKRVDGYHDLEMVMVPIDLFDVLEINIAEDMIMECDKTYIPLDERNTVIKAYHLMKKTFKIQDHHHIRLVKNIPAQAGLAGGSTDGAAVIRMFNEMYRLDLTDQQMIDLAIQVGADVPFCLFETTAKVEGVGEIITPLKRTLDFYLFLIKPKFGISTKALFEQFKINNDKGKSFESMVHALESDDYAGLCSSIYNRLQQEAVRANPQIGRIVSELLDFGFDCAAMTGSGSVIYGITKDEDLVNRAVDAFVFKYPFVKKTRIIG